MDIKELANSSTHINILKRALHIIAITQWNEEGINWNANTLSNLISLDEEDLIDSKAASTAINKADTLFDVDLEVKKGARKISGAVISPQLEKELALFYSNFVISDHVRRKGIELLIKKHEGRALWIMGRLYFASIENKKAVIDYTPANSREVKSYKVHPYHLAVNKNSYYLVSHREKDGNTGIFPLHRIDSVKVLDEYFNEEPPSLDEIYRHSFGSFVSNDKYEIVIEYDKSISVSVEESLYHLNPEIESLKNGRLKAKFIASDIEDVCREFFYYGNKVEIKGPTRAREIMLKNAEEIVEAYR